MMSSINKVFKSISLLTVVWVVILVGWCSWSKDESVSKLAQCLKSQWATMYGTNRCSHCQAQKELFGYEAFTKVNFVDCDKQKNACVLAWVEWYPTWVFKNGTRLQGTQSLEKLASQVWCTMDGTVLQNSTGQQDVSSGVAVTWVVMTGTR
jgi:hypothetical protein